GAMPHERDPDEFRPSRHAPVDAARPRRREPGAGTLDAAGFESVRSPPRARPRPRPRPRWLAPTLCAIAVALALLLAFRRPLSDRLWRQTRAKEPRAQGAQALAQSRLSAPDGSGARELYEAALAMAPARSEAGDGLMRVAQVALARASEAI